MQTFYHRVEPSMKNQPGSTSLRFWDEPRGFMRLHSLSCMFLDLQAFEAFWQFQIMQKSSFPLKLVWTLIFRIKFKSYSTNKAFAVPNFSKILQLVRALNPTWKLWLLEQNVINFLNFAAWQNYQIFHYVPLSPLHVDENRINVIISQKLTFMEF